MKSMHLQLSALAAAAALSAGSLAAARRGAADVDSKVDRIFAKWTASTPGCAVAASVGGGPALARAYGMADLEHDVRNTADTIFEAGSVSKQFTAAAVLLLARDGKLSLDDPARTYIPELPQYGDPLTIRHMLNHTSGLRDWGSVAAIAGWPRTSRVYTHAHVLDIVGRQRALNFTPGTRWSYSNTGYNLAAIIISRVSGTPFADFTRRRIFEPAGMSHTSWRDDHTRVVKGRAIAYVDGRDGFHTDMPFEDVHGNGGLLTTVGDLLKWNEHFGSPKIGDEAFVREQQQPGHFNDGRVHQYAFGLSVGTYKGLREVSHSGSTAGYTSFLTRFPDQRVSVAVLCNATSGQATQYAHGVADVYLADRVKPAAVPAAVGVSDADLDAVQGWYRSTQTGVPVQIVREKDGLRAGRTALVAVSATRFIVPNLQTWEIDGRARARVIDPFGSVETYERVPPAKPGTAELRALTGTYTSDEAETTFTAAMDGDALVLTRRPDTTVKLTPIYADGFDAGSLGFVVFRRDPSGVPDAFSISEGRVWDLRFTRLKDNSRPRSQQ